MNIFTFMSVSLKKITNFAQIKHLVWKTTKKNINI